MYYKEFCPHHLLRDLVQCYFVCTNDTGGVTEDKVYAAGCVELLFNTGEPQQIQHGNIISKPNVQLWGQTIEPFHFTSSGKHCMFGIRFFPHTAACFFKEPLNQFNNQVLDFTDFGGKELYARLAEATLLEKRMALADAFLLKRFTFSGEKVRLVNNIIDDLSKEDFFENIHSVASRYGMSPRHLQTIFLQYTGITPKLFHKITRFQKSLQLVASGCLSLTSVAYQCGYFDQAHFNKDFKFFTGSTPSHFLPASSTDFVATHKN